jgi:hypothetical protein
MWLVLLMSCKPAEPATPDYDRCYGFDYTETAWPENLHDCCRAAGREDCELGFLAVEALWGPMGQPQLEDAYYLAARCDDEVVGSSAGWESQYYCEGYCNACPDYNSDLHNSAQDPWVPQDEGQSVYYECQCHLYR